MQAFSCAVAVTPLSERELRASGALSPQCWREVGATTATAPPELLAPVRRSPRVSTRPTLGTLKFCSTRWPDHARSRGTFRACHFSFGQSSELSVPLDGEWPEQIVESRVAAFATQKIVSFSQSVPAEVSKLSVGATCHGTTRLETCIPDEIRVCTLGKVPASGRAYRGDTRHQPLAGRESTTGLAWDVLVKRAAPVSQQSERTLHRGLRSLLHPLWA